MTTRAPRRQQTPQKRPPQARTQATIEAIFEATIRLLERSSLEATMTRIAEVAGVSVGTLYHHFADREAILHALQEREFTRALELLRDVLDPENVANAPRETIERVVRGLAELYAVAPALHRLLAIEAIQVTSADRIHAFDLRVIEVIRHFLLASRERLRIDDVDAAAFVAFQSVRATMLATLLERPAGLDPEKLIAQLVDMILRYLVRDAEAPPVRPVRRGSR